MSEMGQAIELTGQTVEEAIDKGLQRLGVDREDVEVDVLEEASRGVFGIGGHGARVRLKLKEGGAEPIIEAEEAEAAEPTEEPEEAIEEEKEGAGERADDDEARIARGTLLDLLSLMGLDEAKVEVRRAEPGPREEDPPWVLNVTGPGTDALIGHRGKTLDALQYITRLIVGREFSRWVHIVVDVQGFKARRAQSLRKTAQRIAEQAVRTSRTVKMEPMPPHERRVIHLALRSNPDVQTESVGEGDQRRVTVIPQSG